MSAIDVLYIAIVLNSRNDDCRVLLSNVFVGEEAIHRGNNFSQRHTRSQLRINHSLQSGREQRGRDSLAAHIGQHNRKAFGGVDGIEEIAANLFAGKISSRQLGEWNFWNRNRHQPLLNRRRNR